MRAATSAWPTWSGAGLIVIGLAHAVLWAVAGGSNDATVLDERLFIAGAVMVAIAIGAIAAMTLAAFVRTSASAPMALAIRAGLVGLQAAQATGVWMLLHGLALVNTDADPLVQSMSTVGAAGSLKFATRSPCMPSRCWWCWHYHHVAARRSSHWSSTRESRGSPPPGGAGRQISPAWPMTRSWVGCQPHTSGARTAKEEAWTTTKRAGGGVAGRRPWAGC